MRKKRKFPLVVETNKLQINFVNVCKLKITDLILPEMKKFTFPFFLVSLLWVLPLLASAQTGTFTKVFFDMAGTAHVYATIATHDQGFLIAGDRNDQPLVMKIDQDGNILWQKRLSRPYSRFLCAIASHDSGFLLAGTVFNLAPASEDFLCVKLNASGDTLWSRAIDMGIEDRAFGITESVDHEVVITGYSTPDGASAPSIAVMKLDSAGNLLWGETFYSGNSNNVGRGVCQTPDGGFMVTGSIASATPYNEGLILMKLAPDGTLSWIKRQASTAGQHSQGHDLKVVPGGLVMFNYSTDAGMGLLKTNLLGDVLWSKGYGWSNTVYYGTPGPKLSSTSAGGFQFAQYNDMFGPGGAARTDSSGNLLWSSDIVVISNSALETSDGGCLVTGNGPIYGVSLSPSEWPQIGLVKTDSTGFSSECVWGGAFWESPSTIIWSTPSITSTLKGTISAIHPAIISSIDLDTTSGCVRVFGSVAEDQPQPNSLLVFPNPTDGDFSVQMDKPDSGEISSLEIYNSLGALVYRTSDANTLQSTVIMHNPPAGIYLVRAICEGNPYMQRLVVCR